MRKLRIHNWMLPQSAEVISAFGQASSLKTVKYNYHFSIIIFEASGEKRTMFFSDWSDLSDESDWSAIRCYHFITRLSLNGTADKP
jgi:hypothetical protein